jgi:hypothetical protein
MPRSHRLAILGGLLAMAFVPSVVTAHEITDIQVDCEGQAIVVSGKLFGQDGGKTVTVTGPDGYLETFVADQDELWSVALPLGPNGDYSVDWPESGDFGPVTFAVECDEGVVLPATATPTPAPTQAPEGVVLPETGEAPQVTLPPTDMDVTRGSVPAGDGVGLVALLLGGILTSAAVSVRWSGRRSR